MYQASKCLLLNLPKLIGEIHFVDFLRLEILRLKFPSVYILLFSKRMSFYLLEGSTEKKLFILSENEDKSTNKKQKLRNT